MDTNERLNSVQQHAKEIGVSGYRDITQADIGPRGTMYHRSDGTHDYIKGDLGPAPEQNLSSSFRSRSTRSNDDWMSKSVETDIWGNPIPTRRASFW